MSMKETLISVIGDQRVGYTVAGGTMIPGASISWFDIIPNDIGKLAFVLGMVLSCVIIYTRLRQGKIEFEKTKLEVEILREEKRRQELDRRHE